MLITVLDTATFDSEWTQFEHRTASEADTDCASGRCAWRDHRLVCLAKLPLRHAERGAGFRAGRLG